MQGKRRCRDKQGQPALEDKVNERVLDDTFVKIRPGIIRLCKNKLAPAVMLSHLIHLTGTGKLGDGWIYKSVTEWIVETGLKRDVVKSAADFLKGELGVLETDKRTAWRSGKGSPSWHYRIKEDVLLQAISEIENNDSNDLEHFNG